MDSSFTTPTSGTPASLPVVKTASPANGASLAFDDNSIDQTYYLTPVGLIAGVTVAFPANANSRVGQRLAIRSTQTVTLVTINGAGTIVSVTATLAGGTSMFFEKVASNTWFAHTV